MEELLLPLKALLLVVPSRPRRNSRSLRKQRNGKAAKRGITKRSKRRASKCISSGNPCSVGGSKKGEGLFHAYCWWRTFSIRDWQHSLKNLENHIAHYKKALMHKLASDGLKGPKVMGTAFYERAYKTNGFLRSICTSMDTSKPLFCSKKLSCKMLRDEHFLRQRLFAHKTLLGVKGGTQHWRLRDVCLLAVCSFFMTIWTLSPRKNGRRVNVRNESFAVCFYIGVKPNRSVL